MSNESSQEPRHKSRVIFCDNDTEHLRLLERESENLNVEAITISDGTELIFQIHHYRPDVIVANIEMPRLNGHELLKALNYLEIQTPFIFLTELTDIQNFRIGFSNLQFDFLNKPANLTELKIAIEKARYFGRQCPKAFEKTREKIRKPPPFKSLIRGVS